MKLLILFLVVFLGGAALAFKFLPLWMAITLVVLTGAPAIWIIWKIRSFFKAVKKTFADILPKERTCNLAAGETFPGRGFSFTFPVACEVSETILEELETLQIKPRFDFPGAPAEALIVVSTIPREEIKTSLNEKLESAFSQVQEIQQSDFTPVQVGSLSGEQRTLTATKDGKSVKGEIVYLGDQGYSIAWAALARPEDFELLATKYRELAALIQRTAVTEPGRETPELTDAAGD